MTRTKLIAALQQLLDGSPVPRDIELANGTIVEVDIRALAQEILNGESVAISRAFCQAVIDELRSSQ